MELATRKFVTVHQLLLHWIDFNETMTKPVDITIHIKGIVCQSFNNPSEGLSYE